MDRNDATVDASLVSDVEGAALIGFHLLTPFLRSYRTHWGARAEELARLFPGDDLIACPRWQSTHAITVHTPRFVAWQWLVQLGANRGGMYSYEGLENLAGCNLHNADQITPEYQQLEPGNVITIHPKAPTMKVEIVVDERYILIHNDDREEHPESYIHMTWLLYLDEIDSARIRLISRSRNDYSPSLANKLWMGPLFVEPIGFVMERKMLLGIKQHAENHWALQPNLAF